MSDASDAKGASAYESDLAAMRVGSFIEFWNRNRPYPLQGDGEVIVSFPDTGYSLRRSDLLTLIAALDARGEQTP